MWLDRYRGLLCDLDGCLVAGGRLLPGARDLVAYARDRLVIVSNNSTDTPATLAAKLARLNLPAPPRWSISPLRCARRGLRSMGRRPLSVMQNRSAWWSIMTGRMSYC
jgi:ribonucleotide monophosphatase NagD (HAD superfamily)